MGSLNDWAYTAAEKEALDKEASLEEQINIEVEINDTVAKVKVNEVSMEDLISLKEKLIEQGGMSREIANEAQVIFPDFDGGRGPSHYSSTPSQLRYNAAMEAINWKLATVGAGIFLSLMGLLMKFLSWFNGGSSSGDGSRNKDFNYSSPDDAPSKQEFKEQIEEAKETIEDLEGYVDVTAYAVPHMGNAIDKLGNSVSRGISLLIEGKEVHVRSLKDLFEVMGKENWNNFTENLTNPVILDQAFGGPFTKAIEQYGSKLLSVVGYYRNAANDMIRMQQAADKIRESKPDPEHYIEFERLADELETVTAETFADDSAIRQLFKAHDDMNDWVEKRVRKHNYFEFFSNYAKFYAKFAKSATNKTIFEVMLSNNDLLGELGEQINEVIEFEYKKQSKGEGQIPKYNSLIRSIGTANRRMLTDCTRMGNLLMKFYRTADLYSKTIPKDLLLVVEFLMNTSLSKSSSDDERFIEDLKYVVNEISESRDVIINNMKSFIDVVGKGNNVDFSTLDRLGARLQKAMQVMDNYVPIEQRSVPAFIDQARTVTNPNQPMPPQPLFTTVDYTRALTNPHYPPYNGGLNL